MNGPNRWYPAYVASRDLGFIWTRKGFRLTLCGLSLPAVSTNLPVMIWIYGGGFLVGGGQGANFLANYLYDGQEIAVRGKVIVVTFNYRVGPLGFLSTGDASIPGMAATSLCSRDLYSAHAGVSPATTLPSHNILSCLVSCPPLTHTDGGVPPSLCIGECGRRDLSHGMRGPAFILGAEAASGLGI